MIDFMVGDFVKRRNSGGYGRICQVWNRCPNSDAWLQRQDSYLVEPMRYVNGPWVEVLVHRPGGTSPITRVHPADIYEKTGRFTLRNTYARYYFDEY